MKQYIPPKIVNYFTEPQPIVPLAAVTAAEVGAGLALGVLAGMGLAGGRRDIYKGPNKGLMPIDIIAPPEV